MEKMIGVMSLESIGTMWREVVTWLARLTSGLPKPEDG